MGIGRIVRLLIDNKRKELLSGIDEKRKVVTSIFYPSNENLSKPKQSLYMNLFDPCPEEFINRYTEDMDLEEQQARRSYLKSLRINTYNNVPISKNVKLYPVIIYSPGLGGDRDSIIYNIEKLVNTGYIVFTVGHLYDAEFTILPDGKIIEQARHIANSTMEEKEQLIDIRKEDILFLLNELKRFNNEDEFLKEKLDFNKVGLMGHSLGGASVFKAASEDTSVKAVIMLDGSLQFLNLNEDIKQGKRLGTAFLNFRRGFIGYYEEMKRAIELNANKIDGEDFKKRIIMRHQVLARQIEVQKELYEHLSGYKSFIKLNNSEHLTFTDWPVILNKQLENGILPIKEAHEIISEITVRFYNEFLCGAEGDYQNFINSNRCPQISIINKNGESLT